MTSLNVEELDLLESVENIESEFLRYHAMKLLFVQSTYLPFIKIHLTD
jgi:hypothetical protein